jgi:predicted lipoprotein with Yx(FWY)xxD motif
MRRRGVVPIVAGVMLAGLLAACAKSGGAAGGAGSGGTLSTKSIQGVGTVLVNSTGLTLYHLSTESGGSIQCTGQCASVWPPFLESGGTVPTESGGASGALGTVTRPDGKMQITYNGMPLYRYSGDSQPGQANGQGIQGVWFAVTASGSSGSGSQSPSGGGRYGGGGY